MPIVSVIMGIYNCQDLLPNSIESVLNQNFTDWELIMCDDGSLDNTYQIAKSYADKYDNIKLIKNDKNMGLAFTLNQCLKVAKGRYIARLDGDDICLPDRFGKQVDFLNTHPEYEVVGSAVIFYDENGDHAIRRVEEIPTNNSLIKYVPHLHPTIMMRKEIYDALNGYTVSKRTTRGQDADLWFRFYAEGYKGYNMQEPLCKYHKSLNDYKKLSLKVAYRSMQTRIMGFRLLKFPIYKYIYAFKPILSAIIPNKIMLFYHKRVKGVKN